VAVHLMTNTCTIKRKTQTQSSTSAGIVTSWSDAATGVRCAVQASASREATQQGRETGIAQYDVMFPPGTDVRKGDRLTAITGSSGLSASALLAVTGNPIDESGRAAYVYVPAEYHTGEVTT
jgi:head-tail adaptor